MLMTRYLAGAVAACLTIPVAGAVSAQDYPNKPIRILTSAAGSGTDFQTRIVAQGVSAALGQPVIIENRTSFLASEAMTKVTADGYVLMVGGEGVWIVSLLRQTPYDPIRDFSPVSLISMDVNVFVVHPSLPARSIKELIALAKAKPGELNYSSTATGSGAHLAGELFKSMAGINIVRIAYKGAPEAVTALIGGEVQLTIAMAGIAMPQAKSGKLRALAVTSAEPSALIPGLPPVAAAGLPGYEFVGSTGMWAPAKTPGVVVDTLNRETLRVLNRTDVKEQFASRGLEIIGSTPAQFAATIKADMAKMGKVIKDAGIKAE